MKLIGIDTGGTYTDAVRYSEEQGVEATAKARTELDLTVGIGAALDQVVQDPAEIGLVSLSTTLATNALVQGIGGRVGLVFVGFDDDDLDRAGLRQALGDAPVVLADGGHDSMGTELVPLGLDQIVAEASTLDVDAFAVTSRFSVRNPAHEQAIQQALTELGKPVACGHQLSAKLNGPKRALTCVLNARLIGLITELCDAAQSMLTERRIDAPLMIVRGDGSLVSATFARNRPIETILSGPAASLIGAGHLTGAQDIVVSDIGGTTTDIGILQDGTPRVIAAGATVGGYQTMVEAVEMFTHGLGGDSEVAIDTRAHPAAIVLGPRRVVPLSLLAVDEPRLVHETLDSRSFPTRPFHCQFVRGTGRPGTTTERESEILGSVEAGWKPLDAVASTGLQTSALEALISRGLVQVAGFTPSDAAHVLGIYNAWDRSAAQKAADLLASMSDSSGNAVRADGLELSQWITDAVVRKSAEAVLGATFSYDGIPTETVYTELVQRGINENQPSRKAKPDTQHLGTQPLPDVTARSPQRATKVSISPNFDLIGLGASAATYYPLVADLLGVAGVIPEHAEVANAVGAVVGQVRIVDQATITQPSKGQYRVHLPGAEDRAEFENAVADAETLLGERVEKQAADAGADQVVKTTNVDKRTAVVEGKEILVEATVSVIGVGRPRLSGN